MRVEDAAHARPTVLINPQAEPSSSLSVCLEAATLPRPPPPNLARGSLRLYAEDGIGAAGSLSPPPAAGSASEGCALALQRRSFMLM